MRTLQFCGLSFSIVLAAASLAGCGGSQLPANAQNQMSTSATQPVHADDGKSWMDPSAKRRDLLYVTDGVSKVYVYTYPQGRLVGTLTGFTKPLGECVDASGDVFIVSMTGTISSRYPSVIDEYAHGGTEPLQTLESPASASGCAIDPTTGDLAVPGGWDNYGEVDGELSIYAYDSKSKEYIPNYTVWLTYLEGFQMGGYDPQGNLYMSSGQPSSNEMHLVRASAGSFTRDFEVISVSVPLYSYGAPVSVQWDGKHMTVSSTPLHSPVELYRLRISGTSAKVVGTTTLSSRRNSRKTSQVWIQGTSVVDVDYLKGQAGVDQWAYPDAMRPMQVVPNSMHAPLFGLAVSAAP